MNSLTNLQAMLDKWVEQHRTQTSHRVARQVQSIGRYMHDHSIRIGVRRT